MNVITTPFSLENMSSPLLGVAMPFPAGKGAYRPLPVYCGTQFDFCCSSLREKIMKSILKRLNGIWKLLQRDNLGIMHIIMNNHLSSD